MSERELLFLQDLKQLLHIHEAVLCIESYAYDEDSHYASLTFDIVNHSTTNLIMRNINCEGNIDENFIQKLIDKT